MSSEQGSSPEAAVPGTVILPNDFGKPLSVTASCVAEDVHFCADTGVLTVEKLYRTAEGHLAYGIVSASQDRRERRAYHVEDLGDAVCVDDGACRLDLPVDALYELLFLALQHEHVQAAEGGDVLPPAVNA